jgi:hypothetical protein
VPSPGRAAAQPRFNPGVAVAAYNMDFVNSISFSAAQSNWLAFNNGLSIVNLSGTNLL